MSDSLNLLESLGKNEKLKELGTMDD